MAGDAGAAEAVGGEADGTGEGLDGQIAEAVGTELIGQPLLGVLGEAAVGKVGDTGGRSARRGWTCRCRRSKAR